ncbi:MAG: hypothetical protein QXG05_07585 [Nitrososphaerota archaeon]
MNIVKALVLVQEADKILVKREEDGYELPSVIVNEEQSMEMAINEYFFSIGWTVTVGSIRYIIEELSADTKTLYVVFEVKVLSGTPLNGLAYMTLEDLAHSKPKPSVLYGKMLADLSMKRQSICSYLISW